MPAIPSCTGRAVMFAKNLLLRRTSDPEMYYYCCSFCFYSAVNAIKVWNKTDCWLVPENSGREETIKSTYFFCFLCLGIHSWAAGSVKAVGERLKEPGLPRDLLTAEGINHLPSHGSSWAAGSPRAFDLGQHTACSLLCKTIASCRQGCSLLNSLWLSMTPKPPQILMP